MSAHDTAANKELIRDLYGTVYEDKAFGAVQEYYAEGAIRHGGFQGSLEGRKALQGYLQAALGGLSDIEITELHCLAEGDMIAFDFDMAATHSGEMLGVPPTDNRFEFTNAALFRIEDGLVTDEWPRTDRLGLLEGIGLVEVPL